MSNQVNSSAALYQTETVKQPGLVYLCVHGHFYQPPRDDPFTGQIPRELGAEPFNNFNEKINDECYRPNATVGNFEHISFNFGPTLAAWLEQADPDTHRRIVAADNVNFRRYGYGNALAQIYNHAIAPLGRPQDTKLQIEWGIVDFVRRFGHRPDGMWLAETGCSTAVLQMLAEAGIKFTILAPWQADTNSIETIDLAERAIMQSRLRESRRSKAALDIVTLQTKLKKTGKLDWYEQLRYNEAVKLHYGPPTDDILPEPYRTSEPYLVELENGHNITVFFYNGRLSSSVSFDDSATSNADGFVHNWLKPCIESDKQLRGEPQLLLIATDGELYGHHKRYRELFLQHLAGVSAPQAEIEVTFLRHYLEKHPPRRCIKIVDNTSWSCHHGVKRWSTGCECTPGDTRWKWHLRRAFDVLATETDAIYAREASKIFKDSYQALSEYINVWLGHEKESDFLARHLKERNTNSSRDAQPLASRLLKSQMYKHQMYTSCAWFFEDIDRIEPKNALAAAAITFRLLGRMASSESRQAFQNELALARSNRPPHFNGLQLYLRGLRRSTKTIQPATSIDKTEVTVNNHKGTANVLLEDVLIEPTRIEVTLPDNLIEEKLDNFDDSLDVI